MFEEYEMLAKGVLGLLAQLVLSALSSVDSDHARPQRSRVNVHQLQDSVIPFAEG